MAQMKLTPLSEMVDEVWGEKGTPERDRMENQLKEELQASGGPCQIYRYCGFKFYGQSGLRMRTVQTFIN